MDSVGWFFYGAIFGVFFALIILTIAGMLVVSVVAGHFKIKKRD